MRRTNGRTAAAAAAASAVSAAALTLFFWNNSQRIQHHHRSEPATAVRSNRHVRLAPHGRDVRLPRTDCCTPFRLMVRYPYVAEATQESYNGDMNGDKTANSSGSIDTAKSSQTVLDNRLHALIPRFAAVQDQLRNSGYAEAAKFPQIVVVGVQSAGKSSVLELLAGEEFLPKGEGTVTRRPIVLTLHDTSVAVGNRAGSGDGTGRRGCVLPDRNSTLLTFAAAERAIAEENARFTDRPLRVDVFSPDVVDLRLVDLPGLVQNPVAGQPADLRTRVKGIVDEYASQPGSVLLAVTPANSDPQTSEALRQCRRHDPRGERTLAVLTKPDLLVAESRTDSRNGDEAVALLGRQLRSLPLRLGYVAVRARSKADREAQRPPPSARPSGSSSFFGRSSSVDEFGVGGEETGTVASARSGNLAAHLESEQEFFHNHAAAFAKAGVETGTSHLASMLNRLLESRVASQLPEIVNRIRTDLAASRRQLRELGGPSPQNDREQAELIMREVSAFLDTYLGAGAADVVRRELAQTVYTAVHSACRAAMPRFAETHHQLSQKKFVEGLPKDTPEFWSGHEDVRYRRWRDDMNALLRDLQPAADSMARRCVELLRARITPALQDSGIVSRPNLASTINAIAHEALSSSVDTTTEHVRFLVNLESNISYNADDLAERYDNMRAASAKAAAEGERMLASGGTAKHEVEASKKQDGSAKGLWWRVGAWGGSKDTDESEAEQKKRAGHDNPFRAETGRYGQLWTAAYLDAVAERLSTNIYNALCVEIIDNLEAQLRRECTVELLDTRRDPAERQELLSETPAIEQQRRELEGQIRELERADETLSDLLKHRR